LRETDLNPNLPLGVRVVTSAGLNSQLLDHSQEQILGSQRHGDTSSCCQFQWN
jgi:hypothetical protein